MMNTINEMRQLIEKMNDECFKEINESVLEYIDHVENDEQIMYELRRLRDLHDDIWKMSSLIDQLTD